MLGPGELLLLLLSGEAVHTHTDGATKCQPGVQVDIIHDALAAAFESCLGQKNYTEWNTIYMSVFAAGERCYCLCWWWWWYTELADRDSS